MSQNTIAYPNPREMLAKLSIRYCCVGFIVIIALSAHVKRFCSVPYAKFLDALASLVLMIETHSLTDSQFGN